MRSKESQDAATLKRTVSKKSELSDMRSYEEQRNTQRAKAMEAEQRARELREEIQRLDQ